MSDSPAVAVAGLSAGYAPGRSALEGVAFEAGPGETVAVLGPNGGGKTTLFKALLGQLPSVSGRIELRGEVAYVPQTERSRLDFPVHALDVALMGTYGRVPWYRRLGRDERSAAASALQRVGLEQSGQVRYGALSGGQRQRVLIARALAQGAEVLLLDEPLTGVDRPSAERVLAVIDELRAEGRTLLVATHDVHQARAFDRVLCLNRLQVAFGAPARTLTADTLRRTYGGDLLELGDGRRAVAVQHHHHDDPGHA